MFGRRTSLQGYSDAVSFAKTITQRLKCVNRELEKPPTPTDNLTKSLRDRVCDALDNHKTNCEKDERFVSCEGVE